MKIIINGKEAAIKKGSSFDYVSENSLFSGADDYTLSIELPLKDCPNNQSIFGNIHKKYINKESRTMPCEIISGDFYKHGFVTIVEVTDVMVKVQFLEGRSAQNFDTDFDKIYINMLDIGYPEWIDSTGDIQPYNYGHWDIDNIENTIDDGQEWQSLPWVNNYSGNIQNDIEWNGAQHHWKGDGYVSFQCYMIELTKRIFSAVGYDIDLSPWYSSPLRFLLCCNSIPGAWEIDNYAMALPHWTLSEYVHQLELLLSCEFSINHETKKIGMIFISDKLDRIVPVKLTNIVNEYTASQVEESDCKYKKMTNVKYAECSHEIWKYQDCPWVIDFAAHFWRSQYWLRIQNCAHFQAVLDAIPLNETVRAYTAEEAHGASEQKIFHDLSEDKYYVARQIAVEMIDPGSGGGSGGPGSLPLFRTTLVIQSLNNFHGKIIDNDAETEEIRIVPAWLDDLGDINKGLLLFMDCGEYDNIAPSDVGSLLQEGIKEQQEVYDKIYVAFWEGDRMENKYVHPYIEKKDIDTDRQVLGRNNSLQIGDSVVRELGMHVIDRKFKYTYKFLSDSIPNVQGVFIIAGCRYVCERITATFNESTGMSQLIKGEFYRIID